MSGPSALGGLLALSLRSRAVELLEKAVSLLPPEERDELLWYTKAHEKALSEEARSELRRLAMRPK